MTDQHDQDSKTEEATEKRIEDAIAKGNVPFSREAGAVASLFAMLLATVAMLDDQLWSLTNLLRGFLDHPGQWAIYAYEDAGTLFFDLTLRIVAILMPLLALLAAAGVASSALQNAPRIAPDRIKPKLSKISIRQGIKRTFGANGWMEFGKSVGKFTIIGAVSFLILRSQFDAFSVAVFMQPDQLLLATKTAAIWLIASVAVIGILIVVADVLWARHNWRHQLKMTRHEVKDEMKDMDGDPLVKLRFRSLARDRLRRQMISAVPTATMVVANPTHFAVALKYVRHQDEAPVVVAKGMDLIALKIREIASDHQIPIIEDKPLARSLYDNVHVDQMIPPEFYDAVAGLILYLENAGRRHATRL